MCSLDDLCEDFRMIGGEVGEDFAVKLDIGFFEPTDKFAVGKAILDRTGADFDLPVAAGVAFLLATVFELKSPGMQECFLGGAILVLAAPGKPLGMFEQVLAAFIRLYSSFDSWHVSNI